MDPHNGRVDHLDGSIVSGSKCSHEPAPYASSPPADKAIVTGGMWAFSGSRVCVQSSNPIRVRNADARHL
jgi:hypothetical protein